MPASVALHNGVEAFPQRSSCVRSTGAIDVTALPIPSEINCSERFAPRCCSCEHLLAGHADFTALRHVGIRSYELPLMAVMIHNNRES